MKIPHIKQVKCVSIETHHIEDGKVSDVIKYLIRVTDFELVDVIAEEKSYTFDHKECEPGTNRIMINFVGPVDTVPGYWVLSHRTETRVN